MPTLDSAQSDQEDSGSDQIANEQQPDGENLNLRFSLQRNCIVSTAILPVAVILVLACALSLRYALQQPSGSNPLQVRSLTSRTPGLGQRNITAYGLGWVTKVVIIAVFHRIVTHFQSRIIGLLIHLRTSDSVVVQHLGAFLEGLTSDM